MDQVMWIFVTFFLLSITTSIQVLDHEQDRSLRKTQISTDDPYKFLHIIPNPDGTITRIKEYYPKLPPNTSTDLSFSKDTPLNTTKNTWVRVYLPKTSNQTQPEKLPIVIFAHGGGFIVLSAASPTFHTFCAHAASRLGVLVVSVEYRLAPEHRLPAAYEDVLEAMYWVRDMKDEWVREYGDVSRCILMGESAGGNIAYTVGLRASTLVKDMRPLKIHGMVLVQPFFGGIKRSKSELKLNAAGGLPLAVTDVMWNLSLPIGADRSYFFCNPFFGDGLSRVKGIKNLGWRVAVAGCDGDPLYDRQVEMAEWLKRLGVDASGNFTKGDYHGVFVTEFDKAEMLFQFVSNVFSSYLAH